MAQMVKNLPAMQGLIPGSGRSPGERNANPLLPEKSHGQTSRANYSPWDHKESDGTEQLNTFIASNEV